MPKKASEDYTREGDEKQRTNEGLTIPVPERKDFFDNLDKVAPKPEAEPARSGSRQRRTRRER